MSLDYRNLAMMLHIYYLDGLFDTVDNGWRYDFALGGVPSLCLFVGFIFCPESPRYIG
jgi:SP family galactose:H+ symporter-like MFS transporter